MQSGALLRMVQIYLKAWLMSFHAYSMTGCTYITLWIYCDGRMTVIIRRCVNLTETVQFLRQVQSGKYDRQNDKAITEMWPISSSRHMLKQDQPVIQTQYIWHPFTLPTSRLFVCQLNWAENTKSCDWWGRRCILSGCFLLPLSFIVGTGGTCPLFIVPNLIISWNQFWYTIYWCTSVV